MPGKLTLAKLTLLKTSLESFIDDIPLKIKREIFWYQTEETWLNSLRERDLKNFELLQEYREIYKEVVRIINKNTTDYYYRAKKDLEHLAGEVKYFEVHGLNKETFHSWLFKLTKPDKLYSKIECESSLFTSFIPEEKRLEIFKEYKDLLESYDKLNSEISKFENELPMYVSDKIYEIYEEFVAKV